MMKISYSVLCALLVGAVILLGCIQSVTKMKSIDIDLGRNILETARSSGIPQFGVDDVNGNIEYSVVGLPEELTVRFKRPGLEIESKSVFAIALVTDKKRLANEEVYRSTVQLSSKKITSHPAARQYLNNLLAQFANGRWERHIPDDCPAVTGRSTAMDLSGELDSGACPLDPAYEFNDKDYLTLFKEPQRYQWTGDNVLATLKADYSETGGTLMYSFLLTFEDHKVTKLIEEEVDAWEKREGDAKGWNTTKKRELGLIKTREQNKLLEQNAVARGDRVVPR
jgi:hypothetical protein